MLRVMFFAPSEIETKNPGEKRLGFHFYEPVKKRKA